MGSRNSINGTSRPVNIRSARSTLWWGGVIFAAAGIIMLVAAAFLVYDESRYYREYELVRAEISDIITDVNSDGTLKHEVFVSYELSGQRYENVPVGFYDASMQSGQIIELFADPASPLSVQMKREPVAIIIIVIMGVIFTVAGLVSVKGSADTKKRLVDSGVGEQIYATVVSAGWTGVRVNHKRTYQVTARWDDPYGIAHEFKSEHLYFDPSLYIKNGDPIRVYVDPNDYNKYYVCAQELLGENEQQL